MEIGHLKFMKKIKLNKLLIVVLLIAAFLRLYKLGINPPHLTPDEAALGYNAYSILKTGKDEYGKLLPIVFKSFGDFKPGLYIYTAVPSIAVLGLTEFSTRLPSAVFGVIAVSLIYFIVEELFENKRLSLLSALVLALSPWHIHFSRGAWEINLSLTLTLAGIYFFLLALKDSKKLFYSAVFFGLTLLAYQGAKLSSVIVLISLILVYWKRFLKIERKILVKSAVLGLLVSIPVVLSLFQGKAGRLKVFSVFSYKRPQEYIAEQLSQGNEVVGSPGYYLFHSETYNTLRGIAGRWFNHYSGRFLFFEGDWQNPRHSSPYHGVLLISDILFLVVGGYMFIKRKNAGATFIFLWLILAPFPSALSRDQVHAVRSYQLVIPLSVILAFGLDWLFSKKKFIQLVGVGVYTIGFIYFLDSYFVHQPIQNSQYWEYGYKQAVKVVEENKDRYDRVHFRQSFAQPYIFYLFYTKYPPANYQKQANLIESEYGDVGRIEKIDNIYFLPIDWTVNRGDKGTLFVADPIRIPPGDSNSDKEFEVVDEIYYLDGKEISQRIIGVKK